MECREAQKLIRDYMYGQLPADKKEDFVSHIRSCRDCYEELDIYYMVEVGPVSYTHLSVRFLLMDF